MKMKSSVIPSVMRSFVILAISGLLLSCKKDKPSPELPVVPATTAGKRVLVVNEGAYNGGNASISLFDAVSGTVDENYFQRQNDGASLGDVAQGICRYGSDLFIIVNNSGKIVVCDTALKKKYEITGLGSPRFIEPLGNGLAYLSDLYAGKISVMDLGSGNIVEEISLPGSIEMMLHLNGRVYVCNAGRDKLFVINSADHKIIDSLFVGTGAASLVLDGDEKLWVLSAGDFAGTENPRLSRISTDSLKVEKSFLFEKGKYPSRLCANAAGDTLYYLLNGVNCLRTDATAPPSAPLIEPGGSSFYALEANPENGNIYVSDVIDYMQRSTILVYTSKGEKLREFKAGIISTDFYFD